ncbi:transketolase [Methylocystis bryophila]|uniref:Transketolase n=1 Tax=Methylocystis bryophila TaxID=655015 RepID=A0A1W6MTQ6_9HYPH|nr:transketolase [Methylocystis bryophila]ARN80978.1 transketolase [Methylocystis bryophila]BDV36888.1 transketolase [Methylocystis bryophila]
MTLSNSNAALDQRCINAIRFLSVDMVQKADSGHPGLPLGAAPMAYVLWSRFLKHNPKNPKWNDRDRFVLSAGHGSALLYSLLHLTGYDLPLQEIERFRQWDSKAPGHPERGLTPGVEITTGPLGQGFANAVGFAIAERHLAMSFNRPGFDVIDHRTFVIMSDGDMMEGVAAEAASLAGHLRLGKLICLYDENHVTLSAGTDMAFTENCGERFDAYGWHVQEVANGNDLSALDAALRAACDEADRPSLIRVRTHLGYGSPHKQDSFEAHGSPLGADEVRLTKQNLGWPTEPTFLVPQDVASHMREAIARGCKLEEEWSRELERYEEKYAELAESLQQAWRGELPDGWDSDIPEFQADAKGEATRVSAGKVMNAIAPKLPALIGGSADLNPSTFTALKGLGDFEPESAPPGHQTNGAWSYAGRNIWFGVREHAMGAVVNGLAAHGGALPFGATFLIFSDYMRPPIRLASIMQLHVVFVFTHDSVALGEDGPTHQPVEQLASLRAIPGLTVIRPADANETAEAWRVAVAAENRPVALALSRQKAPTLDRSRYAPAEGLRRGAYVLADAPNGKTDAVLIASGSEVNLIVEAQKKLEERGIHARAVSMPSWELFEAQPKTYRDEIFPRDVPARLAVEAGATQGWSRYVGDRGDVLGLDHFGASAPGEVTLREFGFSVENVCKRVEALL